MVMLAEEVEMLEDEANMLESTIVLETTNDVNIHFETFQARFGNLFQCIFDRSTQNSTIEAHEGEERGSG